MSSTTRNRISGEVLCDESKKGATSAATNPSLELGATDFRSDPYYGCARRCAWEKCRLPIGLGKRKDSVFCGVRCRQASHRFKVETGGVAVGAPIRCAYADPPYPGKAYLYPERAEVDHEALIARLVADYPDGWALSTSAEALPAVLRLPSCPTDVRVCIHVKAARLVKSFRAIGCYEALIVWRGRPAPVDVAQELRDVLIARSRFRAFPGAMTGMKPPAFAEWMFGQLGLRQGDVLDDLYPGSGAVGVAWRRFASTGDASPDDGRICCVLPMTHPVVELQLEPLLSPESKAARARARARRKPSLAAELDASASPPPGFVWCISCLGTGDPDWHRTGKPCPTCRGSKMTPIGAKTSRRAGATRRG